MTSERILYKNNIWKFYIYRIFTTLSLITPIFVLFLQENKLSYTEIMLLQAIYTIAIILFTVPTGAFADKFSRKYSIFISSILLMAGLSTYASSYTFTHFLIAELIYALATAFWQGSGTALVYDSLLEVKKEKNYKKVEGIVQAINNIGWGIGSIIGAFIATIYGFRAVFWFSLIPIGIGAIVPLFFKETKVHKSEESYLKQITSSFNYVKNNTKLLFFITYFSLIFAIMFSYFFFIQPVLDINGVDIKYFGIIYFLYHVMCALGSYAAQHLEFRIGEKNSLFFVPLFFIFFLFMLSSNPAVWIIIILIILQNFVGGYNYVVLINYINQHTPSQKRATVIALTFFVGNIFFSILSPIFGWISDVYGIFPMFFIMGIMMTITILLLIFTLNIKKVNIFEA